MRASLERHFRRKWYGGDPPSALYRMLEQMYRRKLGQGWHRPVEKPPVPVIVVGNLTAGGAGKTPVVIALVRYLLEQGHAVAVISRGYGGQESDQPVAVTADSNPAVCGDEPVLIARSCVASVWVCRQRKLALEAALDTGAEVIVSDDGLQHQALPRSFECCVIDGRHGLGNGHLLPAGPLRQPVDRLEEVDQVLIKDGGFRWAGASMFRLQPLTIQGLSGADAEPAQAWAGREADAVCAIAHPEGFFETLQHLGIRIRARREFADHHDFKADDLAGLNGPVLVTAKDAVKLDRLDLDIDVRVLEIEARLPDAVLAKISQHVQEYHI
jgi:tetraacyldisaccharide 4'-kinase